MHRDAKVSIVVPAYNEEGTIAAVVADFRGHPAVDEVVVVANNCTDRTEEFASAAGARVVRETARGYGCALRRGMDEAHGDYLVLVEADGSFRARDLDKFLCYLPDCAMAVGTRTTKQMVQQGANMDFLLRWGNVVAAKILEFLWYVPHEPRLTDVGCTYRALHARAWRLMRDGTTEAGPAFSPEMICEALRHGLRVIEIPVHYFAREGGESKHSKGMRQISRTALKMLRAIFRKRFQRNPPPDSAAEAAIPGSLRA
jgi:glycosyltransferase involved in cell wall biosynthesis